MPLVMVSSIVRRLQCYKCERRWNWLDPSTPHHCPYCGEGFKTVWPVELKKGNVKVPQTWPMTRDS